jgi:hypothetical protein
MSHGDNVPSSTVVPGREPNVFLPLSPVLKFIAGLGIVLALAGAVMSRVAISFEIDIISIVLMIGGGLPAFIIVAYGKWKSTKTPDESSVKDT